MVKGRPLSYTSTGVNVVRQLLRQPTQTIHKLHQLKVHKRKAQRRHKLAVTQSKATCP